MTVAAQVEALVDSIVQDKLFYYDQLDYRLSPHYQALLEYDASTLRGIDSDNMVVHLYQTNAVTEQDLVHDLALDWPAAWRSWIDQNIVGRAKLIRSDIVFDANVFVPYEAARLLLDEPVTDLVAQVRHPLLRGYIGRALVRNQALDVLDRVFPHWIADDRLLLQEEGCNHYTRQVGDYVLRGASGKTSYQQLIKRYQYELLQDYNTLEATADLIVSGPLVDSLVLPARRYLDSGDAPFAGAQALMTRPDRDAAALFHQLVDQLISGSFSPRRLERAEAFFTAAGKGALLQVNAADVARLHQHLSTDRRPGKKYVAWPFYRWLYLDDNYKSVVESAVQQRLIPREQLLVSLAKKYKVTFK